MGSLPIGSENKSTQFGMPSWIKGLRLPNRILGVSCEPVGAVRERCKLDAEGRGYIEHAMEQMNFSARAHDRISKVSRILAELTGKENIGGNEVLEAIQLRSLNRQLFK